MNASLLAVKWLVIWNVSVKNNKLDAEIQVITVKISCKI